MDTTKWKSVAITADVYEKLRKLSKNNDRSLSGQVSHLVRMALIDAELPESRKRPNSA